MNKEEGRDYIPGDLPCDTCSSWHRTFGACELVVGHRGLHSRHPRGIAFANTWSDVESSNPSLVKTSDDRLCEAFQAAVLLPDDPVDHPKHYGGRDDHYEAIKVIEAWDLGFCLGNAVKYIARCEKKGNPVEDLRKAAWYLDREITRRVGG